MNYSKKALQLFMAEKNLKQKDLAEILGISKENMSKKFNGKINFTAINYKRFKDAFRDSTENIDIVADAIFFGEEVA